MIAAMGGDVAAGLEAAQPGSCAAIATALVDRPGIERAVLAAHMAPALPAGLLWAVSLPLASTTPDALLHVELLLLLLLLLPPALLRAAEPDGPASTYSAALRLVQNIEAELARVLTQHPEAAAGGALAFESPSHRAVTFADMQSRLLQLSAAAQPLVVPTAAQRRCMMRLTASAAGRIRAAPALADHTCRGLGSLVSSLLPSTIQCEPAAEALATALLALLAAECDAIMLFGGDAAAAAGCPLTEHSCPAVLRKPSQFDAVAPLAAGMRACAHVATMDAERALPVLCRVHWLLRAWGCMAIPES